MSTFRQILSVNVIVGCALVFGLINNLAIAAIFGLNRLLDAYFASAILLNLFMVLMIDFLGKNFLPIFAARYESSPSEASRLTSLVVTQLGISAIVVAVTLVVFSEQIFSLLLPGFTAEEIDVVVDYFIIMAPSIVIMTINVFHGYVWQHSENYNRVVIARLFVPLTLTAFILGLGHSLGTKALAYGFLCGQVIASVLLIYGVPYDYKFRIGFRDKDFLKIIRNSSVLMSTGLIARSRGIIAQYFGSQIGEGAISAITIAQKICKPIHRSALQGIQMILFSRSTKAVARENMDDFARMHNQALMGVFLITIPIAVWYAVEGELIVRAVFQRGAFTEEMVGWVYAALVGLSCSIIFMGAIQMVSNAFYALDRISVPATIMPLGTILFLVMASFLAPEFGLLGLTATTSMVSAIVFGVLIWKLKQVVVSLAVGRIIFGLCKYLVAAVIAVGAARLVGAWVEISDLAHLAISMVTVGIVYLSLIWLSGDQQLLTIIDRSGVRDWLQRRDDNGSLGN